MRFLVLGVILGYRLIPKQVRRLWSFGESTSHLALDELQSEDIHGLAALNLLLQYAVPHRRYPERGWAPMPGSRHRYDPDPTKWWNN